jgi:hypothetical protein
VSLNKGGIARRSEPRTPSPVSRGSPTQDLPTTPPLIETTGRTKAPDEMAKRRRIPASALETGFYNSPRAITVMPPMSTICASMLRSRRRRSSGRSFCHPVARWLQRRPGGFTTSRFRRSVPAADEPTRGNLKNAVAASHSQQAQVLLHPHL